MMRAQVAALVCIAAVCLTPVLVTAQGTPETAAEHITKAWEAFRAEDNKLAKREFERAAKLKNDSAEAYVGLAAVARSDGKLRDAMKQVDRALEVDPGYADAHYMRGRLFFDLNRIEDARGATTRLLEIDPKHPGAYLLLADVDTVDRKFGQAVSDFERARSLSESGFDKLPKVQERYEAVKDYAEFRSHDYGKNPVFVNAKIQEPYPRPKYTPLARDNDVSGKVTAAVRFGADGKVDRVIVLTGLPDGLTQSATDAMRSVRAQPATLDGKPIASWTLMVAGFTIR